MDATLTTRDGVAATDQLDAVLPIYAAAYAEPPYLEGPEDVADFANRWPAYTSRPGFRLVTANIDGRTVGFAFGYQLTPDTAWWSGMLDPVDPGTTSEHAGRTFVVLELAVLAQHRKQGIGRALHGELLRERAEERVTLTVRPEAIAVVAMYRAWGYAAVGRNRPGDGLPIYLTMVREL